MLSATKQAIRLTIQGIVQGVGFRPFIFRLAEEYGVHGWIRNTTNGVEIHAEANPDMLARFCNGIPNQLPPHATITTFLRHSVSVESMNSFQILSSSQDNVVQLPITADLATCSHCVDELFDPNNRRYRYPFISCTHCGPRYSIIEQLPYDRPYTTMNEFPFCPACAAEYEDVHDRRFHAQTNACEDCGPSLTIWNGTEWLIQDSETILASIQFTLNQGGIVAVKSLGGYLLLADATNATAVDQLRKRKNRPYKPLATLCATIEQVRDIAYTTALAERWLSDSIAPIVIMPAKNRSTLALASIAPQLNTVGVMLPASPVLHLIARDMGIPLIATSANLSGSPIIYEDDMAATCLPPIADLIVGNNRKILHPQDDSVLRITPSTQQTIWLRRGRGLAPHLPIASEQSTNKTIVAYGADLKSTRCWQTHTGLWMQTQFLGHASSYDAQQSMEQVTAHINQIYPSESRIYLSDAHPGYASHQHAEREASKHQDPHHSIWHHEAHAAALIGEHNAWNHPTPILIFAWDGVGLGPNQEIWGSPIFFYAHHHLKRIAHFQPFPLIAMDRMATDGRLAALSLLFSYQIDLDEIWNTFSTTEQTLYRSMLAQKSTLQTDSAGRLFDAVAALLNILNQNQFEGQSAMYLEAEALRCSPDDQALAQPFPVDINPSLEWNLKQMLLALKDNKPKESRSVSAYRFHLTLATAMIEFAAQQNINTIGITGGLFQNALLVDLLFQHKYPNQQILQHKLLPPNDENISFGQIMHYLHIQTHKEKN